MTYQPFITIISLTVSKGSDILKEKHINLTMLNGSIYRSTQVYTTEVLKKYHLGSGSYPYLLTLYHSDGLNQNQISKELDVDKAMSTRVIKKLIDLGYIRREISKEDSRANQLYLTDLGKSIIPDIKKELLKWNEILTSGLNDQEKEVLFNLLCIVVKDMKNYRKQQKVEK